MRAPDDAGTVTAELAVGITALMVLLGFLAGAVQIGVAQLRATDGAAAAARAAARGEPDGVVRGVAVRLCGSECTVEVSLDGGSAHVRVQRQLVLPAPGRPRVGVHARAQVPIEHLPGTAP